MRGAPQRRHDRCEASYLRRDSWLHAEAHLANTAPWVNGDGQQSPNPEPAGLHPNVTINIWR